MACQPWPLLRNPSFCSERSALRLVVHGRSGGRIPACCLALADAVSTARQTPVLIEALTAETPPPSPRLQHQWLVPLLLLPGSHVRHDLPAIRQRLRGLGATVTLLPFLGAWRPWVSMLRHWLSRSMAEPSCRVVVHHPLRPGPAERYLHHLARELACPLVPADAWQAFAQRSPASYPLPLALAPNRMSEVLRQAGGSAALLEDPVIRSGLIDLLVALP
mgnify:FL=1